MTTQAPDLNSPAAARTGIAAGVLAYIIWGLMPIYWRLLGEASSLEILCLRIIGSLVFIFGYLAAKGRLGELSGVVRGLRSDRPLALLLVGAAFFSSANWLVNIVGVNTGHVVELGIGMFLTPLMSVALGVVFFREKLTPIQWISVLLPLVGVLIMIWGLGRIPWIAILVSSTWAVYSAIKKKVPLSAWIIMSNMLTQTIGYGFRASFVAAGRQGLFLIPALFVLPVRFGIRGLQWCQPVADALTFVLGAVIVLGILKELKGKAAEADKEPRNVA